MGCGASVHVTPKEPSREAKSISDSALLPVLEGSPKSGYEKQVPPKGQTTNSTSLGTTSQLAQSRLESFQQSRWKIADSGSKATLTKQDTQGMQELSPFSANRPQIRTQILQKHSTNIETYSKPESISQEIGNLNLKSPGIRFLADHKAKLGESRTLSSGVKIRNVHPKLVPSTPETGRFIRKSKRGNSIGFQGNDYNITGNSALPHSKLLETVKERSHKMHETRTTGTKARPLAVKLRKNETLEVSEAQGTGSHRSRKSSDQKKMTISNFADYARGTTSEAAIHRTRSESNPATGMPRSKTPKDQSRKKQKFFPQPSQDSNMLEAEVRPARKLVTMRSEMLDSRRKSFSKTPNIQIVVNLAESATVVQKITKNQSDHNNPMSVQSHGECSCSQEKHAPAQTNSEEYESVGSKPEELMEGYPVKSSTFKSARRGEIKEGNLSILHNYPAKQSGQISNYTFMRPSGTGLTEEDELKAPSASTAQFKGTGFLGLPHVQAPSVFQQEPYKQLSKIRVRSFRNLLKEVEQEQQGTGGSKMQRVGARLANLPAPERTQSHGPPSLQERTGLDPPGPKQSEGDSQGRVGGEQAFLSSPTQRRLKRLNSSGQANYQAMLPTKVHALHPHTPQTRPLHRRQERMPLVNSRFASGRLDRDLPVPGLKTQQSQNQESVDKNAVPNANLECLLSKENEEDGSHSLLSRD